MEPIPRDTIFRFPRIDPGYAFHSLGVHQPFDIAFLDGAGKVKELVHMVPPFDVAIAPVGTTEALEALSGVIQKHYHVA